MLLVQEGHAVTSPVFLCPQKYSISRGPASRGTVIDSDRDRQVQGHFVPHHSATWGS